MLHIDFIENKIHFHLSKIIRDSFDGFLKELYIEFVKRRLPPRMRESLHCFTELML